MKKLTLGIAILAMAGVASATILVPNGDFETGDNTSWVEVQGGGLGAGYQYPTSGGVGDSGYGQIDSTAGSWAIWVANAPAEIIPLSYFGVSAGDTITVTMDMIELNNPNGLETAGIKMENWTATGVINDTGDMKVKVADVWTTYTWDFTIDSAATHIKFVPVQHNELSIGYDNVGVVPEPATLGLLGLAGAGLFIRRRLLS